MTGKDSRPSTEPLFSKGSRSSYPIPDDYNKVEYVDFIQSHLEKSENILIWQQISQGRLTCIFGPSKLHSPKPSTSWWKVTSFQTIKEWFEESWDSGKNIYSLAFDGTCSNHYAAYLMQGYGGSRYRQSLRVNCEDGGLTIYRYDFFADSCVEIYAPPENVVNGIYLKDEHHQDKQITSCTADYSNFYMVITKNAPGYGTERLQRYRIRTAWSEINDEIQRGYKDGMAITGLCYCSGKRQYLLVMTEMPAGQHYRWFHPDKDDELKEWEAAKYKEGYHPTIRMWDPNFNQSLSVMTTDSNRSGYTTYPRMALK